MDELGLLGTSTDGGDQNEKLLEKLTHEQTTLGNLAPGQRFSLADQGKSIRTIFAAADDDDDEDFFKEFDVEDLDNEPPVDTDMRLRAVTPGTSEDAHTAKGACETAQISAPVDTCLEKEGPVSPQHPRIDVQRPASPPEAVPQAESEDAMEDDTLPDKPQEAAHAVTDTIMQDADGAEGKSAERAADKEMADQDASVSTEEEIPAPDQGMQHTAGTPSATGAAQVSHEPVSTGTAPLPAQQAGVSGAGLSSGSAAKPPTAAGPGAVSGSRGGAMQTAQVRSASAGSVPNSSAGTCSAGVAEQEAAQMYSPAAGILTKASGGGHTAAADLQPLTHRCPVSMTSSALAATPSKEAAAEVPSKAPADQMQTSQLYIGSPGVSPGVSKASTYTLLAAAGPAMDPGFSGQQQQQAQAPDIKAPRHFQQSKKAADTPEVPAAAAAAPKTAAPAAPAAWAGQPGRQGPYLGSSAVTPPLPARLLFPSPMTASTVKAPSRVLPMPRATLSRLPQIIRVNAPARPQPPALAVPAAAAKPSVLPAFPIAGAGATPAAGTKGLKTPVRSAWAGAQAGSSGAHNCIQPTQRLQKTTEATGNADVAPTALTTAVTSPGAPSTQQQTPPDAALGIAGTQGRASNGLDNPPVICPDGSDPAAPSPGYIEGSLTRLGSPNDQPRAGDASQAREPSIQPSVNLQLLHGQHQLEQMVLEAQRMADQALELKVMAAIVGNRVTRLNSPMLAAKLHELRRRAEQLLKPED